jgi:hypothetical protein
MTRKVEITGPDSVRIDVSKEDFALLRSALAETNEALGDWEFETRVGVPRERLLALLQFFLEQPGL